MKDYPIILTLILARIAACGFATWLYYTNHPVAGTTVLLVGLASAGTYNSKSE